MSRWCDGGCLTWEDACCLCVLLDLCGKFQIVVVGVCGPPNEWRML